MEAEEIVKSWGNDGRVYKPTPEYQKLLRELIAHFKYRLDTNFAKMDRIVHPEIESFKERIYKTECSGMEIYQWQKLLASRRDESMKSALRRYLGITEENIDKILD